MCYWYTPDYDGCHNCKFSYRGMTTGRTFKCDNSKSIWSRERREERKEQKLGRLMGTLPCDHTCELFEKGN